MDSHSILDKLKRVNLEKAQKQINDYILDIEKENRELKESIRTYNEREEIQKMAQENYNIRHNALHISSDKEKQSINDFLSQHYKSCKSNSEITIIGSGMGNLIKVKCIECNIEKDVTDIESW